VQHPIRIVLVETSHPGNIGAAARALKNMCLDELVLVRPAQFPHPDASARASGAEDVLTRARVEESLPAALGDCGLVLATTSRDRDQYFRVIDVHDAAREAVAASHRGPVAVLFGSERTGLSNAELDCAHVLLRIPANPEYASLNLAMAVQLVAYEILRARLEGETAGASLAPLPQGGPRRAPLANAAQLQQFYAHLAQVLEQIDFRDRTQKGTHLMNRLRRFFQRAEPDENEINILRGILTAVQQRRRRAGEE
jgi:TrmH family RNA methyltransferase